MFETKELITAQDLRVGDYILGVGKVSIVEPLNGGKQVAVSWSYGSVALGSTVLDADWPVSLSSRGQGRAA